MSEITPILEDIRRQVTAGPGAFERVARRRDRKRRNQRIATAALALILAAAAIGGAIRVIGQAERQLPLHQGITPENVRELSLAWGARLGDTPANTRFPSLNLLSLFPPKVSEGMVFVATNAGMLYAFDASCGTAGVRCRPTWVADAGGRIASPPVVADGMVFLSSAPGVLSAFPAACGVGGATCHPTWTAETGHPFDTPAVANGLVYGIDPVHGVVYAFDEHCGAGGETCEPLWTARTEPATPTTRTQGNLGGYFWPVVASGGVVYAVGGTPPNGNPPQNVYAFDATTGQRLWWGGPPVTPEHGTGQHDPIPVIADGLVIVGTWDIYAFRVGCRTDGGRCQPTWTAPNGDWRIVRDDTLYVKSFQSFNTGSISAYDLHCATGGARCDPLWTAQTGGWGDFVAGDDSLVSTTNRRKARFDVFPLDCGSATACQPRWTTEMKGARTPLVAGGLLYVPTIQGNLYAFPLSCGSGGKPCAPLWTAPGVVNAQTSPPTISGDRLFVASADGKLFAFALPAHSTGQAPAPGAPTFAFYLGLLVAAAILVLARRRSRGRGF